MRNFKIRAWAADWPMWRYDAERTEAASMSVPEELHVLWARHLPPLDEPAPPTAGWNRDGCASKEIVLSHRVGKAAVPFDLTDTMENVHTLQQYADRWLLLVFHRHLAGLPCREHLSQLRRRKSELDALRVNVLAVTFESGWLPEAYVNETELPWPLLIDESRDLYFAYGMSRGRWWDLFGPPAWWVYAKLLWRGRKPRRASGDVTQLGGDVLIDPRGIVRLQHIGRGPADRPDVEDLLKRVPNHEMH